MTAHHQSQQFTPGDEQPHGMDMGMKMYFHQSLHVTVLFRWWEITTPIEYILSCVVFCLMAVTYEWISTYRIRRMQMMAAQFQQKEDQYDETPLLINAAKRYTLTLHTQHQEIHARRMELQL